MQLGEADPENFTVNHYLGVVNIRLKKADDALYYLHKALTLKPLDRDLNFNLAGTYRAAGRLDKAQTFFRNTLAIDPAFDKAYQGLTDVCTLSPDDPLARQLLDAVKQGRGILTPALYFAAGKILDDNQQYAEAFRCYLRGNAANKLPWNSDHHSTWLAAVRQGYSPGFYQQPVDAGLPANTPVFLSGCQGVSGLIRQ